MAATADAFLTTHAKTGSLKDELAAALPEGFRCKVRYVHTPLKSCDPLFPPPPGAEPEKTRSATHLLAVSVTPIRGKHEESETDVFALGIEVFVYTTKRLTTLFVSKADSTGYLPQQRPSPVKVITTTFLQWLSAKERHAHPTRKLVISLFARAQKQYLFPGSSENSTKHVLDDRQLIKWWARVLDPIFPKKDEYSHESADSEYDGYITVPGYEGIEIKPFFPPHNYSSGVGVHWKAGNPLLELAETRGIPKESPTRCLLPRFPDDPKARFMQDLDDEVGISEDAQVTISPSKRKNGKWAAIRDLGRFWEAMEFRQECSSGRVVGFLWLVIRMQQFELIRREVEGKHGRKEKSQELSASLTSSDPPSVQDDAAIARISPSKRRRKPLSGPIVSRQPRLKGGSSSLTASSDLALMLDTAPEYGLALTKEGYDKAMHTLLHLDFANLDVAIQSTSRWVSDVSSIGGVQSDWSFEIVGSAKLEEVAKNASSNSNLQVNDLSGMAMRNKRKPEHRAVAEGHAVAETRLENAGHEMPAVNILGGGMIRKKIKPSATYAGVWGSWVSSWFYYDLKDSLQHQPLASKSNDTHFVSLPSTAGAAIAEPNSFLCDSKYEIMDELYSRNGQERAPLRNTDVPSENIISDEYHVYPEPGYTLEDHRRNVAADSLSEGSIKRIKNSSVDGTPVYYIAHLSKSSLDTIRLDPRVRLTEYSICLNMDDWERNESTEAGPDLSSAEIEALLQDSYSN